MENLPIDQHSSDPAIIITLRIPESKIKKRRRGSNEEEEEEAASCSWPQITKAGLYRRHGWLHSSSHWLAAFCAHSQNPKTSKRTNHKLRSRVRLGACSTSWGRRWSCDPRFSYLVVASATEKPTTTGILFCVGVNDFGFWKLQDLWRRIFSYDCRVRKNCADESCELWVLICVPGRRLGSGE